MNVYNVMWIFLLTNNIIILYSHITTLDRLFSSLFRPISGGLVT